MSSSLSYGGVQNKRDLIANKNHVIQSKKASVVVVDQV